MILFQVLMFVLSLTPQFPKIIYTHSGHALEVGDHVNFLPESLAFRNELGVLVSIRYEKINFARSFNHRKARAPAKPEPRPIREIPWEHPHFRNKNEGFHAIEINSKSLKTWASAHAIPRQPDPLPENAGKAPETVAPPKQKPDSSQKPKAVPPREKKPKVSDRKRRSRHPDTAITNKGG